MANTELCELVTENTDLFELVTDYTYFLSR